MLYDNLPASFGQDQAVWLPSKKGVFEADQAVWLPSKKECLRQDHSIVLLGVLHAYFSLGRASRWLGFHERRHFSCGMRPLGEL